MPREEHEKKNKLSKKDTTKTDSNHNLEHPSHARVKEPQSIDVRQQENIAGGDIAGHDIVKPEYHFYDTAQQGPLDELIRLLRKEMEKDKKCKEIMDELQHYEANIDDEGIVGLEAKLRKGERDDLIISAMKSKEVFVKKLAARRFYRSAQQIYVYLLGKVLHSFRARIRPLIVEGQARTDIDAKVNEHILEIMENIIRENVDLFTHAEVEGMVYFLTGNCHISWH